MNRVLSLSRTAVPAAALSFLVLIVSCSPDPFTPSSGEFVFSDTWGKDDSGVSREIGPGHGDGQQGSEIGAFNAPTALAVRLDEIFVLDSGNSRIQKFSLYGAPRNFSCRTQPGVVMNSLGEEGSDAGEFFAPADMCLDAAGRILVADSGNFRVQVFDGSGLAVKAIGRVLNGRPSGTNAPGGFFRPVAVAVDPSGNIYVLDNFKCTIDRFSSSLAVDAAWQSAGSLRDQVLASAVDLEFHEGFLFVLCRTKIMKFDPSGALEEETDLGGFGQDRLAGATRLSVVDGRFAVSDGNYVKFFDSEMNFLYSIGGVSGDGPGELSSPSGAALSGDTLYIADTGNNRLQLFRRR